MPLSSFYLPQIFLVFLNKAILVGRIFEPVLARRNKIGLHATLWARPGAHRSNEQLQSAKGEGQVFTTKVITPIPRSSRTSQIQCLNITVKAIIFNTAPVPPYHHHLYNTVYMYLIVALSKLRLTLARHLRMHWRQKTWLQLDRMPKRCSLGGCFCHTTSIHTPHTWSLLRCWANDRAIACSCSLMHSCHTHARRPIRTEAI